jgi:hypothetical protein
VLEAVVILFTGVVEDKASSAAAISTDPKLLILITGSMIAGLKNVVQD